MEQFKNPKDLAGQLVHLPESKVTQKNLNDETRSMFKNRQEGLDYIAQNFANDEPGRQNAMARLDKVYPSTRAKWDKYFRHIGDGNPRTIDKYNRLLGEIESELPFENQKEHDKWLDLGSRWMGEEEWPNMTENLIQKAESIPLKHTSKDFDEMLKGNPYANGIDWGRGMDYMAEKLGQKIPENVSQLYRKGNYVYGVEGQDEGEPIDKILFRLGGK